jgi:hypothetical protein
MRLVYLFCVLGTTLLVSTGCDHRPKPVIQERAGERVSATKTFETTEVDQAITAYRANPTEQNKAMVEKAFAELDVEIAELKQKAASESGEARIETARKLADLQAYREKQRANYSGERAEAAAESAEHAMEGAAKDVGRAIEKTGEAIREAVD